ncbi:MAG: excinuclease ABC subunit UvrA [Verrucomicrobiota bacterium]|nr:excinuclease ABC subunit UvrA [Verrucomicrobiota bacterium]
MPQEYITIQGAREHNLKDVNVRLPRGKLIVVTGMSGSGKSSLAFDTIYAEGQRRYVESLSAYARQFLEQLSKPNVDHISGLSPAIAIEQRSSGSNPRSTVATTTEIYDYLRLLYAHLGKPHCPDCGRLLAHMTVTQAIDHLMNIPEGTRIMILAPFVRGQKGEFRDVFEKIKKEGFVRMRVDGQVMEVSDERPKLSKSIKHNIDAIVDRLVIDPTIRQRVADSVELAMKWGKRMMILLKEEQHEGKAVWREFLYSEQYACAVHGPISVELSPGMFSFNNPHGACQMCGGLGSTLKFDEDLVVPDPALSLIDNAIVPWAKGTKAAQAFHKNLLLAILTHYEVPPGTPFKDMQEPVKRTLLYGSEGVKIKFKLTRLNRTTEYDKEFEGVIPNLQRRHSAGKGGLTRFRLEEYMNKLTCTSCNGQRLRKEALAVKVGGRSIIEVTQLSINEAYDVLDHLPFGKEAIHIAEPILKEVLSRLGFLKDVGLEYLSLDRENGSLSGGESQRIRLATQIGAGLAGVLYVLDEPSIGLHQRDNDRLIKTLYRLRDLGNTVIVVEHDEDTIRCADYIVDMGPRAGIQGGYIMAEGTLEEVLKAEKSLTARYLKGEIQINVPKVRKKPLIGWLEIVNARENNLKNITARIPIGLMTCVTGVSGSGKSTLVMDILWKAISRKLNHAKSTPGAHDVVNGVGEFDKIITIDQSPIGRTPRSSPATYTGMFTHIRDLFAQIPLSRVRGFGTGRFSFNVKGGRCEDCEGDGLKKIEMHFLPDVYVVCEVCEGKRYNRETLEVTYKGKNIADVLAMTVDEASSFFRSVPQIHDKCASLTEVGLGYIKLGQQATQLSGGEAQRVKLATELARKSTGRTLYIFDEPTTGLHFGDVHLLLEVLHKLRDSGNTLVVIEHNLDVIKTADWIIDMGPEGGTGGGTIVAEGPPEKIVTVDASYTGHYLKRMLPLGSPLKG